MSDHDEVESSFDDDDRSDAERRLVDEALDRCPRDDDGNVDEDVLRKLVASLVDIDVDAERERIAKRLISRRTRIGSSPVDGQIQLFDTYDYEPDRLIRDNHGNIVEQHRAGLAVKQDEASRKRVNANRVARQADISQVEAERFADWAIAEADKGRSASERTFGAFITESGIWLRQEAHAS